MEARNTRLGLVLFALYTVFYSAFVLINALQPSWMEGTPLAGVNWAVWSAFGLISLAFVLALVYGAMCGTDEAESEEPS